MNLSASELEVAALRAQGYSTKEIGRMTNRSYKTIDTHIANIRRKLGNPNGVEWMRFLRTFPGPA